jgi:hypothetical protein
MTGEKDPRSIPASPVIPGVVRSILAVIAGYATLVLGVGVFLALLLFLFPGAFPAEPGPYTGPAWILALELVFSGLVAVGGGYVCGLVAGRAELGHALVLVCVMAALGLASAFVEAGLKPLWSTIALPILGAVGVIVGAKLRRRHRERKALERASL